MPGRRDLLRLGLGAALLGAVRPTLAAERVRVIGLMLSVPLNQTSSTRYPKFKQNLRRLGWIDGVNCRMEVQPSVGGPEARAAAARALVSLEPDVVVTSSSPDTAAVLALTRTIPIVFATAADPVGSGFVQSLARPGGNVTGFTNSHAGMSGKWLEFLKEIAPAIRRVGVVFNPQTAVRGGNYFLEPLRVAGPTLGVAVEPAALTDPGRIDALMQAFGGPEDGLVMPPDSFLYNHRQALAAAAARHRVPAIYPFNLFVAAGGLMSYSAELEIDGASYVDRILRGASPAELPVQSPRKYELMINRPVAVALGLTIPLSLLLRADEIVG